MIIQEYPKFKMQSAQNGTDFNISIHGVCELLNWKINIGRLDKGWLRLTFTVNMLYNHHPTIFPIGYFAFEIIALSNDNTTQSVTNIVYFLYKYNIKY